MTVTDIKNKIPEGWQRTFLSESENFRIVGSRVNYWKGLKPYLSTKSVQGTVIAEIEDYVSFNNRPSRANMQPEVGVTAFAKMGNTFKVLYNDEEIAKNYILSTGFCLVKPKIDPKYFFHFIASDKFQNNKELYCEGSTQKAISQKDYDKLEILFPEKQKEQQKIAEVLTTIDEAIEKTDAIIEKNKRIKQGLMQDLFRYGIDEHGNIRSEKTHKFKTVKIGNEEMRIPEEWEIMTIENDKFASITTGNSDTQDKIDDGDYPFYVRSDKIEKSTKYIFDGEGVLTSGDGVGVGKIYHYVNGKFDFHQRVYLIYNFQKDKVFGKYFYEYFKEHFLKEVSKYSAKTTVDSVRLKMISEMLIPIPKYNEQIQIANLFNAAENKIFKEQVYKQKLLSLKRGLMEDLLTGAVRVNSLITN